MTTAPSWQDLFDVGLAKLQSRAPSLLVVPGDVTDAVIAGGATMGSAVVGFAAARILEMFLDGAEGQALADLARDRGVEKDLGAAAVAKVTITRASDALGAGTIVAGTRLASQPDTTGAFAVFTTNSDVVFGATDLTKTVNVTCSKIGVSGNVAASTIVRILDPQWDPTLTFTNTVRAAGGSPEESDPDLRDRVRGFFLTQSRGTVAAIIYGAKTVPGVRRANVTVDYDTGIITVYVSDADGNANLAMTDAVAAELLNWAAAADIVNVVGATLVIETISLTLTVRTGVDIDALLDKVRNAVVARVGRLAPGETLYRDMIAAAARGVDPDAILQVLVVTPAANVTPATGEVLRTNTSSVSFV